MKEPSNLRPIPGAALGPILRCLLAAALWVLALSSNAQLANSGWPKVHGNAQNTGQGSGSYATSTLQWSFQALGTVSDPAIGPDGTVYFTDRTASSGTADLYAVDGATGKLKWSDLHMGMTLSSPAIGANGILYLTGYLQLLIGNQFIVTYYYLFAINSANGNLMWLDYLPVGSTNSPTIGPNGDVYISEYAFAGSTGALKWTSSTSGGLNCPAVGPDGAIYSGSYSGAGNATDPSTGSEIWSIKTKNEIATSPVVGPNGTDNSVYFGSYDDSLYAVDSMARIAFTPLTT